jgi:hypothetical protein
MNSDLTAVAVALVALGLLLFRELGPVRLPKVERVAIDLLIVVLMVALFVLVLNLDGLVGL